MSLRTAGTTTDSWGSPAATSPSTQRQVPRTPAPVQDDWDNDDDEVVSESDPQTLWEEANRKAPMPELIIAGSSTRGIASVAPPVAAIQPVLRILKRPTASPSSSSTPPPASNDTTSSASSSSYAAREARYQAARERIFGEGSPSPSPTLNSAEQPGTKPGTPKSPRSPQPGVQIIRDPKGPSTTPQDTEARNQNQVGESRGFSHRRGKRRGGKS